ncbi:2-(1,2-epoxy-1,2-dihydrophenyl)acetyl-CoA isomerase [Kroppenstedtia guangzhouensis]|uniref:2-(1,2-epoxy-1,2-dihydrophenyl)acetyl-CoA isomerase n=1 Tax=Kroppenstedtia guangzhouensis TaxID=1274356 RepID=A0ABQ1GDI7_9BACL|nr:enoyl-CoA hydratase-related protein [Kroppenstedtia guangzhouensis]GGA41614.1 2-(1,2-epoxy-1,2-dihydrophenyl)acetyl-CoA isomerase [Kroppenstedtia guangzhouensis]
MFETILYETRGGVATITFNRPKAFNAFNMKMHEEAIQAMDQAVTDQEVRCIVLKGSGKGFSSGADLSVSREFGEEADYGKILQETYNLLLMRMVEADKPIVAALQGPAFGAGLSVALACDFRIAADNASLSMAFVNIGLVPDAGATFFLPRIVGYSRALELAMTGRKLGAEEAYTMGLVNRVVPAEELDTAVEEYARRLAQAPTGALAGMKRNFLKSFENDLPTLLEAEAREQTVCGRSADHREGVAAFFEKRVPKFKGR